MSASRQHQSDSGGHAHHAGVTHPHETFRVGPGVPTPPRRKGLPAIAILGIVVAVLCGLGIVGTAAGVIITNRAASQENTAAPEWTADPAWNPPTPEKPAYQPRPADFTLTVKILEKKCFGSAGCSVQFRVELAYLGSEKLSSDISYELVYEIRGGEDPQINTIEVTGTTYSYDDREHISTVSSKSVLTAVVTSVSPR